MGNIKNKEAFIKPLFHCKLNSDKFKIPKESYSNSNKTSDISLVWL